MDFSWVDVTLDLEGQNERIEEKEEQKNFCF